MGQITIQRGAGGGSATADQLPAVTTTPTANQTLAANEFAFCGVPMTRTAGISFTREAGSSIRRDGLAGPPAWELISSAVPAAVATVDFTDAISGPMVWSNYSVLRLVIELLTPVTDAVDTWLQFFANGVIDATSPNYRTANFRSQTTGGAAGGNTGAAMIELTDGITVGNAANEFSSCVVDILDPAGTAWTPAVWLGGYQSATTVFTQVWGYGGRVVDGPITGVRLLFSSGNIASGKVWLYGMRNT